MNNASVILLILGAALAGTAAALTVVMEPAGAQSIAQPDSCTAAEAWHLRAALRWSLHGEQDYHLGAASAAHQMAAVDNYSGCIGWQDDAQQPVSTPIFTKTGADDAESDAK